MATRVPLGAAQSHERRSLALPDRFIKRLLRPIVIEGALVATATRFANPRPSADALRLGAVSVDHVRRKIRRVVHHRGHISNRR